MIMTKQWASIHKNQVNTHFNEISLLIISSPIHNSDQHENSGFDIVLNFILKNYFAMHSFYFLFLNRQIFQMN